MKEIRRDFYRQLQQKLAGEVDRNVGLRKRRALEALLPKGTTYAGAEKGLTVAIRSLSEVRLIENRDIDRLLVPLEPGIEHRLGKLPQRLKKSKQLLVWDLPFIILDRDWDAYAATVSALLASGWNSFRLNNLAHFQFFKGAENPVLVTGYRLFTLYSQAALAWREQGVGEMTLYIEDDRENLSDLLVRGGLTFNLVAYSQVPMMTTRVPMPRVRPDSPLVSGRDEHYLVRRQKETSTISAETDFSLIGRLHQLRALGFHNFTVDLSHLSAFSPPGKNVLAAFAADRPIPSTSLFNFDFGME